MSFTYEGEVMLGCQEGGFAAPEILLADTSGGTPQGVTAKFQASMTGGRPKTLDEVLSDVYGVEAEANRFGDKSLGRLKITVERA
jgi:hypothetical protein